MRAEGGAMSGSGILPASKPSVDACSLPAPSGPVDCDVLSEDGKKLGNGAERQRRGQS